MKPRHIECVCKKGECPVHSKCCFLPTEYYESPEGTVELLFVGQGGGKDERKKGRPFIGPAGHRLRNQLRYVRKQTNHFGVAFSNTIRDNPEGNRVPTDEEVEYCLPYLLKDIAWLKKKGLKAVVPLGRAAKSALVESKGTMANDRGRVFYLFDELFDSIPVVPTYHPSYFLFKHISFTPKNFHDLELLVVGDIMRALAQ